MRLRDLYIKDDYWSEEDDILDSFYKPVLSNSKVYYRLAGFFSSTCLAVASRGVVDLIKNNGKMNLVVGAKLREADVEAIKSGQQNPEKFIEDSFLDELESFDDESIEGHVKLLAWMVANNKLEIKVSVLRDENGFPLDEERARGYYHMKIGIFEDEEGDQVSFNGSVNETYTGWVENIEDFDVFRSWEDGEAKRVKKHYKKFKRYWRGETHKTKTYSIPEAVKKKFIQYAPNNIDELDLSRKIKKKSENKKPVKLRDYQEDAIANWGRNNNKGIFEMATGTGKTFAALGCLKKLLEDEKRLITIISCPYNHLVKQWLGDLKEFGVSSDTLIADSSNPKWKDKLTDLILDIKNGISDRLIVLTTHDTFSSDDFKKINRQVNEKKLVIVDEVHGIGAPKRRIGLLEDYTFRLGLSATPKRWFDYEGTAEIFDYFGNTVFEFSLEKAIKTINPDTGETYLSPYEYKPYFVELTEDELSSYDRETEKIARNYHKSKDKDERDELLDLLCFKRQRIINNAVNKYRAFESILDEIENVKHCLVYCSPQQIETSQNILNEKDIIQHKFTMDESTKPEDKYEGLSYRDHLLKRFSEGKYDALVAMKCLDEGVDVPSAKIAIIMASSSNPREYIQRRGRVLRRHPNKDKAIIYDIIVVPSLEGPLDPELQDIEKKILEKEFKRYKEFAKVASNYLECLDVISEFEEKYNI